MSANQKSTESDKDRDSDDYENDYDNFAPPPQAPSVQNNSQQQQQGRKTPCQNNILLGNFEIRFLWFMKCQFCYIPNSFRHELMVPGCHQGRTKGIQYTSTRW